MKKMKPENRRFAIEMAAIILVLLLVICIAGYNHYQDRLQAEETEIPGEPLYRITYYLAEDGTVCSMIENLSDEPLTITFPDGYGYPAPDFSPSLPYDWDWGGVPDEA